MSASTAQLQQSTIRQYTLQLRLPTVGGQFLKMAEEAGKQKLGHMAYSGFYCGDAVAAYESRGVQFILSARKTARLVEELKAAD